MKRLFPIILLGLAACCCSKKKPVEYCAHETFLGDNVQVTRIQQEQCKSWQDNGGATVPIKALLIINFRVAGKYKIETWRDCYRAPDCLCEEFNLVIDKPKEVTLDLNRAFYRLVVAGELNGELKVESKVMRCGCCTDRVVESEEK